MGQRIVCLRGGFGAAEHAIAQFGQVCANRVAAKRLENCAVEHGASAWGVKVAAPGLPNAGGNDAQEP
jgi:hypothetical protein